MVHKLQDTFLECIKLYHDSEGIRFINDIWVAIINKRRLDAPILEVLCVHHEINKTTYDFKHYYIIFTLSM